jgi:hypothetical protein
MCRFPTIRPTRNDLGSNPDLRGVSGPAMAWPANSIIVYISFDYSDSGSVLEAYLAFLHSYRVYMLHLLR